MALPSETSASDLAGHEAPPRQLRDRLVCRRGGCAIRPLGTEVTFWNPPCARRAKKLIIEQESENGNKGNDQLNLGDLDQFAGGCVAPPNPKTSAANRDCWYVIPSKD